MISRKAFLLTWLLPAVFLLSGARCGEKPGEGALAKKGYENAAPIIAALNQYHGDKNDYPHLLKELVPDYLKELPRVEGDQNYKYYYREDKKKYELEFDYDAPALGICECRYYSDTKEWSCVCLI